MLFADVAMRGSGSGGGAHAPQMYFTFYTAEVDWGANPNLTLTLALAQPNTILA